MKKSFFLVLTLFLILTCFGCSNSSNSSTSSSDSGSTTESTENSAASDSKSSSDSTSDSAANVQGDWDYTGVINNVNYDITLDLDNNNQFDMEIDEESGSDDIEAELQGTYTADDSEITLDIVTIQNNNPDYFTGEVVENAQVKLKYTMVDDDTLEITNASDLISFIPAELTLTRDK